jgi:hypothetical protein
MPDLLSGRFNLYGMQEIQAKVVKMKLEEFAQLIGKPIEEAKAILDKNESITIRLSDKKILDKSEIFKIEEIKDV